MIDEILSGPEGASHWALTFDDGGASTIEVGEELARRGWRAHFFLVSNLVDRNGFLTSQEARTLSAMGHVVGSHSCSHPQRMSQLSFTELMREWQQSCDGLGELLGTQVTSASVPGGYYSRQVAVCAAAAGIRSLFTSEPVRTVREVNGCTVLGRYAVHGGVPSTRVASVAAGSALPWARRRAFWTVGKVAKAIARDRYAPVREALFSRR